jgi:hypothetical protein
LWQEAETRARSCAGKNSPGFYFHMKRMYQDNVPVV